MKRTVPEMKIQIAELVDKYPLITDREIGERLNISPRFLIKVLDDMVLEEILTERKNEEEYSPISP